MNMGENKRNQRLICEDCAKTDSGKTYKGRS